MDIGFRELLATGSLIFLVFWMGLFPGIFLKYSEKSLENLVVNKKKYNIKIHDFYGSVDYKSGEISEL